jgi:AraC family transcriptional regulator
MFRLMERDDPDIRNSESERRTGQPDARLIASSAEWSICEYTCRAGPCDQPFEERHEGFTIAAVVEGSFTYTTDAGRTQLHPGAWLLGNHNTCFECGHDHSSGDRCIAFHYTPAFFAEISASVAGRSRYSFSAAILPAIKQLMPAMAGVEGIASGASSLRIDEAVAQLAEKIIATSSGRTASSVLISAREERRLADVLQYVEDHASEPLGLTALASIAGVSKYHFLRIFRRTVGMPPYQFLLMVRMRRAALRLAMTSQTVASIAFDTGFGDLSTFNKQFRELFGMSPMAYRRRGSG